MVTGVGIDLALPYSRGKDYSAAVLLGRSWDSTGELWTVLDLWRERVYREADLLAVLSRWHQRYHVTKFIVEQYASTGVVEAALSMHLRIEVVSPTAANQVEAFTRLYTLAKDGQLRIPAAAAVLLDELRVLRHSIGPTGIPHFSAPSGRHDDCAFALGWAVRAVSGITGSVRAADPRAVPILAGGPTRIALDRWTELGGGRVVESWEERSARAEAARSCGPGGAGHGKRGLII